MDGGYTALMLCAMNENFNGICTEIVEAGADLNLISQCPNQKRNCALSFAIIANNREIITLLVMKKAKVFYEDVSIRD